ncbi:MAG: hypothetical protein GY775_02040 [Candidatus Scalindua sp.]|nr:hypothetical protein [Candidatus Scalindua sp.]
MNCVEFGKNVKDVNKTCKSLEIEQEEDVLVVRESKLCNVIYNFFKHRTGKNKDNISVTTIAIALKIILCTKCWYCTFSDYRSRPDTVLFTTTLN